MNPALTLIRHLARPILVNFLLASAAASTFAMIDCGTLVSNIAGADLIVVGRVDEVYGLNVRRGFSNVKVARVVVGETLKGTPVAHVYVLASPTWTCDTSDATAGETDLLLLQRVDSGERLDVVSFLFDDELWASIQDVAGAEPLYLYVCAGRGRLPLDDDGDDVQVWDLSLPADMPREYRDPPPEIMEQYSGDEFFLDYYRDSTPWVPLKELRDLIRAVNTPDDRR